MRDLQYLRETLAPIAARTLDWKAFTDLHFQMAQAEGRPFDEWNDAIQPLAAQVGEVNETMRRDSRALIVLLGTEAPVATWLRQLGDDGDALIRLARERKEAGHTTPTIATALNALMVKYGHDHARFVETSNKAVR